jgi:hypothetical protein
MANSAASHHPSRWGLDLTRRQVASAPPTDVLQADIAYLNWIRTVQRDRTGKLFAALTSSAEYSDAYWHADLLGQIARREAHRFLHRRFQASNVPLPSALSGFRPDHILIAAAEWMGLSLVQITELAATELDARIRHADQTSGQTTRNALDLAWLMLYPFERTPQIQIRPVPDAMRSLSIFQAACVLAMYDLLHAWMSGQGVLGQPKVLPDPHEDSIFTPCLHRYAKSLLLLKPECPSSLGCACNLAAHLVNAPPPAHPTPTGQLSLESLRQQMERDRTTLPPNIRPLQRNWHGDLPDPSHT